MEKRLLGKTGEKVSILGFGCMRLPLKGPLPSNIDEDLAVEMIRHAVDSGVNYVDTAWPYHCDSGRVNPGESEPVTGRALAGGWRDKVLLATKLPTWAVESRAEMDRILDAQLKRLQTDHIDCYLAHNLNQGVWAKMRELKLFDFLTEAKKDGRIKHIGFSFHDRYPFFETVMEAFDWEFAQIQYNYLDGNYQAGRRGVELAAQKGLGLIVMEPLRGGFLIDYMPEPMRELLAKAHPGWSLADWALRWIWDQPEISVVLSGMSRMAQLTENLAIADDAKSGALSEGERKALESVCDFFHARLKANCTSCGYCLPCPQGVEIPKNISYYNNYYLMDSENVRTRTKYFYGAQMSSEEMASGCVDCGECAEKCPQKLPIPELMKATAATFK